MKKILSLAPVAVLSLMVQMSCEVVDVHGSPQPVNPPASTFYAVALSYPSDYDWRRDNLGYDAPCDFLLFRDTVLVSRIPAASAVRGSIDTDRHFLCAGQLYMSSGAGETMLSCCVADTSLHSLQLLRNRDAVAGAGTVDRLVYRRDGRDVLDVPDAYMTCGLYADDGAVCFAYAMNMRDLEGKVVATRHYHVTDGKALMLSSRTDAAEEILAYRSLHGELNTMSYSASDRALVWQTGRSFRIVQNACDRDAVRDCRFVNCRGSLLAHCQLRGADRWNDVFWTSDGQRFNTLEDRQILAICDDGGILAYVHSPGAGSGSLGVVCGDREYLLPDSYRLLSTEAFCCDGDSYCIGLCDSDKKYRPLVIRGRDTLRYDFNGYFTRLRLP